MTAPTPSKRTRLNYCLSVIRLGRPKFLLGGFALYGLGTLCSAALGHPFSLSIFLWGQLAISAIQLTTHYSNDYFDYEADRANLTPTGWSGGSRILVNNEVPRAAALASAIACAAIACLSMGILVLVAGVSASVALPLLGTMLFLSWSYSSPPLRLHSRGAGAPTVAFVVPFLTTLSGFILQVERLHLLPVLLSLPLVALQLNMIFTLEFPDERGDQSVGKRTWVVLFGARRIAGLSFTLIIAAFTFTFLVAGKLLPSIVGFAWLALLPLAVFQALRLLKGDWRKQEAWDSLAFGSVALFFLAIVGNILAMAYTARFI